MVTPALPGRTPPLVRQALMGGPMIAAPLARALTGVAPRRAASAPVLRKAVRAPLGACAAGGVRAARRAGECRAGFKPLDPVPPSGQLQAGRRVRRVVSGHE
ncbi:MAG: hypothetical protein IOC78_02935 [Rhodobacter sp.]|nr:hypothetical protein [Rhodobacter sp.]